MFEEMQSFNRYERYRMMKRYPTKGVIKKHQPIKLQKFRERLKPKRKRNGQLNKMIWKTYAVPIEITILTASEIDTMVLNRLGHKSVAKTS